MLVLQLVVTAAIGAFLFSRIEFEGVLGSLGNFRWTDFVGLLLLIVAQYTFVAKRFALVVRWVGATCTFVTALRAVLVGAFFAQTPLSALGGDAMRGWILYKSNVKPIDGASAVVLDRLLGALSLLLLIVMTLPLLWQLVSNPSLRIAMAAVLSFGFLSALAFTCLILLPESFRRFALVAWAYQTARLFSEILSRPSLAISLVALSLAAHTCALLMILLIATAIGAPAAWWQLLVLTPFPLFLSLLPISIGGWGVREGAIVVAYGLVGVTATESLAISLAFGAAVAAASIPGAIVWLLSDSGRHSRLEPSTRPD
jgi:glycosyltransferase 2 family protein